MLSSRLLWAAGMVAIVGATSGVLPAQTPANPVFEVSSIKRHTDLGGGSIGWEPGGRWVMVNVPLAALIRSAYETKVDPVGWPTWVMNDRFDVEARAAFDPTPEEKKTLLRTLLADRLKFAVHYETQERPVYNLLIARPDGRLGPQIRHIDIDCATYKRDESVPLSGNEPPPCAFSMYGAATMKVMSGGRTMQYLADSLFGFVERPVIDRTGLAGYYAFTLDGIGSNDGLSIFTALQEQLGLKLESARGPVDVLVIDRVEHPTED